MTMSDPALDLATHLVLDAAGRSTSLMAFLVAESRSLPDNPTMARGAIEARWPEMTDADRHAAFLTAANVLRRIARDAAEGAARLDLLTDEGGRG